MQNLNGSIIQMISFLVFLLSGLSYTQASNASNYNFPTNIDKSINYLFFQHNYYVEKNGPDGDCKYWDLLRSFEDGGFRVISEVRSGQIVPAEYANKISSQVNKLLDNGVAPENITIAGHSKGGVITLNVASIINNEKIKYVVMAGCEIKSVIKYKMYPDFSTMKGKMLSIYSSSDQIAASCDSSFSKAGEGLSVDEIVLSSEKGHKLFFSPDKIWIKPVIDWIHRQK